MCCACPRKAQALEKQTFRPIGPSLYVCSGSMQVIAAPATRLPFRTKGTDYESPDPKKLANIAWQNSNR